MDQPKPKYYIGLDVGTQSTKGVLYDPQRCKIIQRESKNYDILPSTIQGRAEQDTNEWLGACKEILSKLAPPNDEYVIGGIGISGQIYKNLFFMFFKFINPCFHHIRSTAWYGCIR